MAGAKEFVMTSSKSPNAKSQLIGVQLGRALRLSEHSRAYQRGWNRLLMKRNNWKSFDLALRGLEFKRAILVLIERPTTFSYFIPAMLLSRRFGFAPCRDRCKIIAMAFSITCVIFLPSGLVADAQSIVVSNDDQL